MSRMAMGNLVFLIVLASMGTGLLVLRALCRHLQTHHPATYASLGQPGSFFRNSPLTRKRLASLLSRGGTVALEMFGLRASGT